MDGGLLPTHRRAVIEMLREVLAQGKAVTFTVRGDSMAPTLSDGDQMRIVPAMTTRGSLPTMTASLCPLPWPLPL